MAVTFLLHTEVCAIPAAFDTETSLLSAFLSSQELLFSNLFYCPCGKAFMCGGIKSFSEVRGDSCPLLPPPHLFDYLSSRRRPRITQSLRAGSPGATSPGPGRRDHPIFLLLGCKS